jgi:hypothetical protein
VSFYQNTPAPDKSDSQKNFTAKKSRGAHNAAAWRQSATAILMKNPG